MLNWLFGTKQSRCARKGHVKSEEINRHFVLDHPKNDSDFAIICAKELCRNCGETYEKYYSTFRYGVQGFLSRK